MRQARTALEVATASTSEGLSATPEAQAAATEVVAMEEAAMVEVTAARRHDARLGRFAE